MALEPDDDTARMNLIASRLEIAYRCITYDGTALARRACIERGVTEWELVDLCGWVLHVCRELSRSKGVFLSDEEIAARVVRTMQQPSMPPPPQKKTPA